VTAQNGYTGSGTFSVTGFLRDLRIVLTTGYSGGSGNSILTITAGASVAAAAIR
jgi:hypothetical protein